MGTRRQAIELRVEGREYARKSTFGFAGMRDLENKAFNQHDTRVCLSSVSIR